MSIQVQVHIVSLPLVSNLLVYLSSSTIMSDEFKEKDVESPSPQREPSVVGEVSNVDDADAALAFLRNDDSFEERSMTAADEKKLVWKIDMMVMPLMYCCYVLQYLDKTLINYAAVSRFESVNIRLGPY